MTCRVAVLGSTGSVGEQTLDIVRLNPDLFTVCALTANRNREKLAAQAREFQPELTASAEDSPQALIEAACSGDVVIAAISGFACLAPLLAALEAGKIVALANKESLVSAGPLVMRYREQIIPVDSEHSSIFQCLATGEPEAITLTASGGPFLRTPLVELARVTPREAVRHPRWNMGAKISVDSATLMNKGLEVIEAAHLFALPGERIRVVIHPQSLVHGIVECLDGTQFACLFATDMRSPISYALGRACGSGRLARNNVQRLKLGAPEAQTLEFLPPDLERFPALRLCYESLAVGGGAPVVLNAANEVAVQGFLEGRLKFPQIPHIVERALICHSGEGARTIEEIVALDSIARKTASNFL